MAPEVALDSHSSYDGNMVDLWGCGVILYTLATGHYPFGDETVEQPRVVYERVVAGNYAQIAPGVVSQACADLISQILVTDPAQRANIGQIKSHAWFTK